MSGFTRPIRFLLGTVTITPTATEALIRTETDVTQLLRRHQSGDFGKIPFDDKQVNEKAIQTGSRILSSYPLKDGTVIWVITSSGWQQSHVLIREEY